MIEQKQTKIPLIITVVLVIIIFIVIGYIFLFFSNNKNVVNTNKEITTDDADILFKQKTENNISILTKKILEDPTNSFLRSAISRAQLTTGKTKEAETSIKEAIKLDNKNPLFYMQLGDIDVQKQDIKSAEENYKKSVELAVKNNDLYNSFIKLVSQPSLANGLNKVASAPIAPTPAPFRSLALFYIDQNKPNEAIPVLEKGIEIFPTYPDYYLLLSNIYDSLGDKIKADLYKSQFDKLIKK